MPVTISNIPDRRNITSPAKGRMPRRLAVLLGSVAVSALFPTDAFAQCTPTGPSDYVCADPSGPQTITLPTIRVTTAPGFSVTGPATSMSITSTVGEATYLDANGSALTATGGGDALKVTVDAGGTFLDADINGVLSGNNGIVTINNGTGSLGVFARNAVTATGAGGIGISATNADSATQMLVRAYGVTGAGTGIFMDNRGTGLTGLFAFGPTLGQGGSGIQVLDDSSALDMLITVIGSRGNTFGIFATHEGSGELSLSAAGIVEGGSGGIFAEGGAAGTNVAVLAGSSTVSGGVGVVATNAGSGYTNAFLGDVTGSGNAVEVSNSAAGTSVLVEIANASGGTTGISVTNLGTDKTDVKASGVVFGGAGDGVHVEDGAAAKGMTIAAVTTTGGQYGIYARHTGIGNLSVTATGATIGGTDSGISVQGDANGTDVTVVAAAVSGFEGAVAVNNGHGKTQITTTGDVIGTGTYGIVAVAGSPTTDLSVNATNVTGATTGIYAANSGSGTTEVKASGAVTGTADQGVHAEDAATAKDMTIEAGTITGRQDGINARHSGTGNLSVTATGATTGINNLGILAQGGANGTDVTLNVASVTGATIGIAANDFGIGNNTVTATGEVTGTGQYGIRAVNGGTAKDLTVSAGPVTGGTSGIYADNGGTGTTRVVTSGTVTGVNNHGIEVYGASAAKDVIVEASVTSGDLNGIRAYHNGTGNLSVTATGATTGRADAGILAIGRAPGTDIAVQAAAVSGTSGIVALNEGSGNTSVITTGNVVGTVNSGISATNAATAKDLAITATNATGATTGIFATNNGTGTTGVTTTGNVIGTAGNGISASNTASGTNLAVAAVDVIGSNIGIYADNSGTGTTEVKASGIVAGTGSFGILANDVAASKAMTIEAGTTHGGSFGISVRHTGTGNLNLTATGPTTGIFGSGITAQGDAAGTDVTVRAAAASGSRGVSVINNGIGKTQVTTTGDVIGAGDQGLRATNGATTTDLSIVTTNVTGATAGILATNQGTGTTDVKASGTVTGTSADGIRIEDAATAKGMTVEAAITNGGQYGINARHTGTGNLSVTATGATTGTADRGIFAQGDAAGTDVTVSAAAVSGTAGIFAFNNGVGATSVTATGGVTGTAGDGIGAFNGGTATNLTVTAAGVTGSDNGIVANNLGTGVTNIIASGAVTGTSGIGVDAHNAGTASDLGILVSDVSGATTGVVAVNLGTGTTEVTATGIAMGTTGTGLYAEDGATSKAMTVKGATTTGGNNGIFATHNGTGDLAVTATGVSTGGTGAGIAATGGASGDNVMVDAATVSGRTGISASNSGTGMTQVIATGDVTGSTGRGIVANNGVTATDLSVTATNVTGTTGGIVAGNDGIGTTAVKASGTVTGDVGIYVEDAASSSGMTVDTGITTGRFGGITAFHSGSGALGVTAAGATAGGGDVGISAFGGAVGTDVAISAAGVSGTTGLIVTNTGTGATSVTTTGDVAGTTGRGMNVSGGPTGTNVSASTARAAGATDGIFVRNTGTGTTSIAATGDVAGTSGNGIDIVAGALVGGVATRGTNLTVGAANVTGGVNGILFNNRGTGNTAVTSTGEVIGGTGDGISGFDSNGSGNLTVTAGKTTGGIDGIDVRHAGIGVLTVTASGDATGTSGRGVRTIAGSTTTDTIVTVGNTLGNVAGLDVNGSFTGTGSTGRTIVNSTGTASGTTFVGINVGAAANSGDVIINANNATGVSGVQFFGVGKGSAVVTVTGDTTGTTSDGIFASNASVNGKDLTIVNSGRATGVRYGVFGSGSGAGARTTITSNGDAIGGNAVNQAGIYGISDVAANGLAITATNASGYRGINAENRGAGASSVTATGDITGSGGNGIEANNAASTTDLVITARNVTGTVNGIQARNFGTGITRVQVIGTATGGAGATGIYVQDGLGSRDMTVDAVISSGLANGIYADHSGAGNLAVTATGTTTAMASTGLTAIGRENGTDVVVKSADASGTTGVAAYNLGVGKTEVTTSGNVVGTTFQGIYAQIGATAGPLSITAGNVSGKTIGILIDNAGTANSAIAVNGVVEGETAGIVATTSTARAVTITNAGTIRNASGLTSDRAVTISGGAARIINGNLFTGTVLLGADDDVFANNGTWNSIGGINDFGGGSDLLSNTSNTTLVGGTNAAVAETTTFNNLELLTNTGTISMRDGGTGDRIVTDGAVQLQAGSTLAIDVGAGTTADLLVAGGAVTIQSGAKLVVNGLAPGVIGDRHTFLTAAGGLTGTFDVVDSYTSAFLGFRDGYTATSAYVEFAQLRALAAAGLTPNQIAAANGVDTLAPGNPIRAAALGVASDAQAQAAFDGLSGEIHPTVRTVMAEDARLPRNAVLERLSADRGGGAIWGQGFGNWGNSDGNRNAANVDRTSYGFLAGVDFGTSGEGLILGAAIGYLDTDAELRARASKASIKTIHGLAYVGVRSGGFSIKAGIGYARADIGTRRGVTVGSFANTLTDSYKGNIWQGFTEAGYRIQLGGGYAEPFVGINGVRAHSDSVGEAGGAAAVFAAARNESRIASTTGVRFETAPAQALSFVGTIGWQHGFGRLDPVNANAFSGSSTFLIRGAAQSRDAGIATVAARYRITPVIDLTVGYDGVLGTAAQDHAAKASLRVRF